MYIFKVLLFSLVLDYEGILGVSKEIKRSSYTLETQNTTDTSIKCRICCVDFQLRETVVCIVDCLGEKWLHDFN